MVSNRDSRGATQPALSCPVSSLFALAAPAASPVALQRAPNRQGAPLPVDVCPLESERFTEPQAESPEHDPQRMEAVSFSRLEEPRQLLVAVPQLLAVRHTRQRYSLGRVAAYQVQAQRILERLV